MGYIVTCNYCDLETDIEAWNHVRSYKRVTHLKCPNCNVIHGATMMHGESFMFYQVGLFKKDEIHV